MGEVPAVHALDEVFCDAGSKSSYQEGHFFSRRRQEYGPGFCWITSENLTLLDLPGTQEFVFQRVVSGERKGDLAPVNRHPQGTEPETVLASRSNDPLTEDYALVGLVPGLDYGAPGIDTCRHHHVRHAGSGGVRISRGLHQEITHRLPKDWASEAKPFEALVRVKIAQGVPVETELVAVHTRR